ncbi:type II secretion system protein GspC [Pendulispora albinea]|uniref:General secretion pathway protein GspC n=1 Tax=Pendulispora albinea TaxID=2741071 RepID=A0ABZ2LY83_9BACT
MDIGRLLNRHFWLLIGALTALAALFGARGIRAIIAIGLANRADALSHVPLAALSRGHARAERSREPHATSADAILARNPFDSETGPLDRRPEPDALVQEAVFTDPETAPPCEGDVKAPILVASSEPDWSFAVLHAGADHEPSLLRHRGGDFNGKTVAFVGADRVWLAQRGSLCQIQLFAAAAPNAPAPTFASAPSVSGVRPLDPRIAKGIKRIGPTEFDIDRSVVELIFEKHATLLPRRVIPFEQNGKTLGIDVFGIGKDTLLGQLGFENGDRISQINGLEIGVPERALEAFARLRTADHWTALIQRNGKTMSIDINIK